LTVEELRDLIATTVQETFRDFWSDPDEGLELQNWVKERLKQTTAALAEGRKPIPHEEAMKRLEKRRRRKA
jgi:phosphoglycolate phosphatase-like HAD superfamily hydrolase